MAKDDVDLKEFANFLEKNPDAYPMYRSLKKGDVTRTPEEMQRAKKNNLAWAKKIRASLEASD